MIKHRHPSTGLCLILVLICSLIPTHAQADDRAHDGPTHLRTTERFGPIGTVYSLGSFGIDGRLAHGEESIWGGELIHAFPNSRVRVLLDSVGQVTLKSEATARLATALTSPDSSSRHLLVASLINGEMSVDLHKGAGAYIQSCGSAFLSSSGATFQIGTLEGRAIVNAASGEVQVSPQAPQRSLRIRLVEPNPDPLKPPIDLGLRLDVERRTTRETQWRVTDEHDKPVPDVPIGLTLAGNIGRFGNAVTFSGTTNAQGIMTAPFTAGPSPAQGSITANIPGTNVSSEVQVTVKSKSQGMRNKILIAAAALATIIIIVDPFGGTGPIQQAPPPTIIP